MTPPRWPRAALLCASLCLLPAAAAWADCQSDFERDNRIKPEAGPFRTVEKRVAMRREPDGRWLPAWLYDDTTEVNEVVPADRALHFTSDAPPAANVILIGPRGWVQREPKQKWQALSADAMQGLDGGVREYMATDGLAGLTCLAQQRGGRLLRVYRYTVNGDPEAPQMRVSVQFDARTGLPVGASAAAVGPAFKTQSTSRFVFDRRIRIEAPAAVSE